MNSLIFKTQFKKIGIVVISDWKFKYPAAAFMYTLLAAHLNSTFNPIFYALFNPSFKKGYLLVFKSIKNKLSKNVRTRVEQIQMNSFTVEDGIEKLKLKRIR
jgi:hypothetical protein